MSWSVHPSSASRHLVLRASAGEILPDALSAALREQGVACGWLRGSGVLVDVELRAYDGAMGALGTTRRIAGPLQVLALEGSIGLSSGEPSFSLRALLARETDHGLETLAGEIASARIVGLEVFVTALDDVALVRALDEQAGVWLLGQAAPGGAMRPAPRPAASAPAAPSAWSGALEASERAELEPRARTPQTPGTTSSMPMPQRPARAPIDFDSPSPEAGDAVDHFAFGRADVLKSDGDRLHLKVHKDGRIREIALEMLKVTRLDDGAEGKRRFRLERRL